MVLIGVWHGASLTFLWFGIIHGAVMVFSATTLHAREKIFGNFSIVRALRMIWQPITTFTFVSLSLIFFRIDTKEHAIEMLSRIFSSSILTTHIEHVFTSIAAPHDTKRLLFLAFAILLMELFHIAQGNQRLRAIAVSLPAPIQLTAYYILLLMIFMSTGKQEAEPFIYFQF